MAIEQNTVANLQEDGIKYVDDLDMVDKDFLNKVPGNKNILMAK